MKLQFLEEVGSLKQILRTSNSRFLIFLSVFAFSTYSLPNHAKNDDPTRANTNRAELKNQFISELLRWSYLEGVKLSDDFQLDRRFLPVSCSSGYGFSAARASDNLIEASCVERDWFRSIKVKLRDKKSLAQGNEDPLLPVLILRGPLGKGDEVLASSLDRKLMRRRLVPKNHVKTYPGDNYLARHNLRQGKILLASDVYLPKHGLVANVHIPRGVKLAPHMVTQKLVTSDHRSGLVTNIEAVKYFETNKPISVGDPILNGDMRKTKLVKRGDTVVVEASGLGFEIKSTAKASGDGYLGEQVVLSAEGGRRIRALVSGKSRAVAIK